MSRIKNKWLDDAPAKTIKGNDASTVGQIKDLTGAQAIALLGAGNIIEALPDADPVNVPKYVVIKQESNEAYVYTDYVETDYIVESPEIWTKMAFSDFLDWMNYDPSETHYVLSDYMLTGYAVEG